MICLGRIYLWTKGSIEHIAKHDVMPEEVEEDIFDDKPLFMVSNRDGKDRMYVLCRTLTNRLLFVVITKPVKNQVKIITARDMTDKDIRLYKKRGAR
ncbi:hypothetical protein ATHSA_p10033 (plasmid) [Athalassotoga saccharophila]|uniref:BrnT family toxin n=1 Tax=Athalassotoga saccharophila TaxID=1441386 RepID=A0A6N4TDM6_9BACT|nr:BrnT family toxin [Athalassotoga saccharophila]BBJ28543.1 hypothetical protein ATHSA_1460 [Athalassotoga saccharophila]BBJ29080.1 hypothetical protein ATHSA_p10033 [Athalassotoga saccharophila]